MIKMRFIQFKICLSILLVTACITHAAEPYHHENLGGQTVKAHWVHLEGTFGNNDELYAMLLRDLNDCVTSSREAGIPHQELSVDQIPKKVHQIVIDIYRTDNRLMTIQHIKIYNYRPPECSLHITRGDAASLISTNGVCNIDLENKKAAGMCDKALHAQAKPFGFANARAIATNPALRAFRWVKTGEKKTIVGLKCDVYELPLFPYKKKYCAAATDSPLSQAPLDGPSGVFLKMHAYTNTDTIQDVTATAAKLDGDFSSDVFAVPADVQIIPTPSIKR